MKLTVDLGDPQDVVKALALLSGSGPQPTPAPQMQPHQQAPVYQPQMQPQQMQPMQQPLQGQISPPQQQAPVYQQQPAPQMQQQPMMQQAGAAISAADMAAAVQGHSSRHGPKATKALFSQIGVAKTSDIPPERYAELLPYFQQ